MKKWLVIRQRHLVDPEHSRLAQANTVLITGIDKNYLDEERLTELFSLLPGGVKKVWLNRNLKEMPGLHDARVKATKKLESAQVTLIRKAKMISNKRAKQIEALEKKKKPIPEKLKDPINKEITDEKKEVSPSLEVLREIAGPDRLNVEFIEADRLVPRDQRPTHRLPRKGLPLALPWTGTKVDTIDWARKEIVRTGIELDKSRQVLAEDIMRAGIGEETYPPLNSAFLLFRQQIGAHMANQILLHNRPWVPGDGMDVDLVTDVDSHSYKMAGTYIEVSPKDVIWRNLNLNPYDAFVRRLISYAITGGLIIVWSIPSELCTNLKLVRTLANGSAIPQSRSSVPYPTLSRFVSHTNGWLGSAISAAFLRVSLPVLFHPCCWHLSICCCLLFYVVSSRGLLKDFVRQRQTELATRARAIRGHSQEDRRRAFPHDSIYHHACRGQCCIGTA